jgi:hypothetical protein
MTDHRQNTVYRTSPGITWVVQDRGVLVIDELARSSKTLSYPEAAVWELLFRDHCLSTAVAMLGWILGIAEEEAQEHTRRCIHEWLETGWIMVMNSVENKQP